MMELAVYACAGDAVLFVPVSVRPPAEAVLAHGPLRYRGMITADPTSSPTWREMAMQIERHLFATVGLGEIALLLGTAAAIHPPDDAD